MNVDSGDHLHSGVVAFVWVTVAAVVGMNLWRIVAAKAVTSNNSTVAGIGRAAGALVQFGG